ncbi:MAG TPA: hypothetical protein VH593_33065 [Ktedonobacteraceae bacterium]|jgi:hypothetical protein
MSNQPFVPDPRYQQEDEPTLPQVTPYNQSSDGARGDAGVPVDAGGRNRYMRGRRESDVSPMSGQAAYGDPNVRRANERYWAIAVISFVLSVLEIVLALRFVFRLLGANQYNGFVAALYSFSYIFAAPFSGIFTNPTVGSSYVFELSTLVAMIIYALVAWGLIALARIVFAPKLTNRPGA